MGKFEDARYVDEMRKEFTKLPTASKATDEDKNGAKNILIDRASEYLGINLKSDIKLMLLSCDGLF